MINRNQLKFHETFQPETGYIAKILELASRNYSGSKFEISERTGIPTGNQKGKVEPHIKYAAYMGLISYKLEKGVYSLSLSLLGEEIYIQDKYLHEQLTKWLCHYGITNRRTGAPQWEFLINIAHSGFIAGILPERLLTQAVRYFDVSVSYEEAFGVVKRSYQDGFFSVLEFLTVNDVTGELKFAEFQEKDELLYVYAYALMKSWDLFLPEKIEITMIELMDELFFGKVFGFNTDVIGDVLDSMSDDGLVSLNRQLFPTTIIRTSTVEEIIPLIYSRVL